MRRENATYNIGDYVKFEFSDEATGISERMWLRVSRCDDQNRLVFGTLDSEQLDGYEGEESLWDQNWLSDTAAQNSNRITGSDLMIRQQGYDQRGAFAPC